MRVSSPIETARRCAPLLDRTQPSESFERLQQVLAEFAEQAEAEDRYDDPVGFARDSVQDLLTSCCVDMAKAVPWDRQGVLKQARGDAVELAKVALQALANLDDPALSQIEQLRKIGEARRGYRDLVRQLNVTDRALLATELRRGE
jgi:hypothetical protein